MPPVEWWKEIDDLGDRIAELSAHLQAATYRLLVMIREFDRQDGWHTQGARSCAHWLNWRIGLGIGAAREKVRVARALEELPVISRAMRRGEVSYSKVRALTRVATPGNEAELMHLARAGTTAHVERVVRAWRRVDRLAESFESRKQREHRHLQTYTDEDGMLVLRGRLAPEVGAVVIRALEAAGDELFKATKPGEKPPPVTQMIDDVSVGQRRADALALVAERSLAAGAGCVPLTDGDTDSPPAKGAGSSPGAEGVGRSARSGDADSSPGSGNGGRSPAPEDADRSAASGDAGRSAASGDADRSAASEDADRSAASKGVNGSAISAGEGSLTKTAGSGGSTGKKGVHRSPRNGSPGDRYQVVVHVDAAALEAGSESGQAVLEDGVRVSAETSRRISCDASKVVMRHGSDGRVLDVGRKTRTIPPAIRRALKYRDRGCRFPGCGVRVCDAHHVEHWADGGKTKLDNLVLLCRRHHTAVHEDGYRVKLGREGKARFHDQRGRRIPEVPPAPWVAPGAVDRMKQEHLAAGIGIGPMTGMPTWNGGRLDLGFALQGLMGGAGEASANPV